MAVRREGPGLVGALRQLEGRFGAHVVAVGDVAEERARDRRIPTGIASMDALLDGGLAAGEPLALVGDRSCGTTTLALATIASAQSRGGEVAWLDPRRSFDPEAALAAGVDLARVLVLRPSMAELPFAAATVARSAAFVLVVMDADPELNAVVARARASEVALLVLAERSARRLALPWLELRRTDWLRQGARTVGWRSLATRPHRALAARLSFAPLAYPPSVLVDEGLVPVEHRQTIAFAEAMAFAEAAG